jgi:hypothetical protein
MKWRIKKEAILKDCPVPQCSSRVFDTKCSQHTMEAICQRKVHFY